VACDAAHAYRSAVGLRANTTTVKGKALDVAKPSKISANKLVRPWVAMINALIGGRSYLE
jgi:hypothetical protein